MRIYGFLIVLAATLFGTASNVAKADVQQVIRDFKQGGPSERTVARLMLIGATTGLQAANTFLRDERKESALYCMPEKLSFTPEQLVDILQRWIDAKRQQAPKVGSAPLGDGLLYSLVDAFPCP
jgi:hypothetical protein